MEKGRTWGFVIGSVFLLILCVLFSFGTDKGTLKIKAVDSEGSILPGVSLRLSSPVMMGTRSLVTEEQGEALFVNLSPGFYEIKSELEGFQGKIVQGIQVSLDKQTFITIELLQKTVEESVTVTAEVPAIDTTRTVIAEYISHQQVESLPVSRDFVGYLQLAPGINMVPNSQGTDMPTDPSGKGGQNFREKGLQGRGGKRSSRGNVYYLDGVNITDLQNRSANMTFNNEVIQEEEVMTSGVPAEYGGGKGIVGNIVSKSGGNKLSGSVNIYGQSNGLFLPYGGSDYNKAADPSKLEGYKDNKYDTAFTLGGPILKDKLWYFTSAQYRNNSNKFRLSEAASSTREEAEFRQKRVGLFGKLVFKLTPSDNLSFMYFEDGFKELGSRSPNVIKTQTPKTDYSYRVFSGFFQKVFGDNLILDIRFGQYNKRQQLRSLYQGGGIPDTLYYIPGTYPRIEEYTFGGVNYSNDNKNSRTQINVNAELFVKNMRIKIGGMYINELDRDGTTFESGEFRKSLDPSLSGISLRELIDTGTWFPSEVYQRLIPYLNENWGPASEAYDFNHDGVLTDNEILQATFSTANEHGLNFWRKAELSKGINKVRASRWVGYLQDDWKINEYLILNAGVRLEQNHYFDSTGGTILNMPVLLLPRIGLAWNIGGRGNQKLTAFYGQFSDPFGLYLVHFAGNITGQVTADQIWLNGDWVTYKMRGSAEQRDASWAPATRDPYSREFSLTHEISIGYDVVISTQVYLRHDRNIVDDYDLNTYVNAYKGNPIWGNLALTYEDFGFPSTGPTIPANFYVMNVFGAKRNHFGVDFDVSKRFKNGSSLSAQYSFKHSMGNDNTDNEASLQGDVIEIDPRNPYMWGPLPGTIPHKIKLFGTYRTPFGLDIGALFYWNSGMIFTESYIFMPDVYNMYMNYPLNSSWTDFAKSGQEKTPAYYQVDLKFNYGIILSKGAIIDLFLDVYNLTNSQRAIDVAYGHNDPSFNYKDVTEILLPMRFYTGIRFRF